MNLTALCVSCEEGELRFYISLDLILAVGCGPDNSLPSRGQQWSVEWRTATNHSRKCGDILRSLDELHLNERDKTEDTLRFFAAPVSSDGSEMLNGYADSNVAQTATLLFFPRKAAVRSDEKLDAVRDRLLDCKHLPNRARR